MMHLDQHAIGCKNNCSQENFILFCGFQLKNVIKGDHDDQIAILVQNTI